MSATAFLNFALRRNLSKELSVSGFAKVFSHLARSFSIQPKVVVNFLSDADRNTRYPFWNKNDTPGGGDGLFG